MGLVTADELVSADSDSVGTGGVVEGRRRGRRHKGGVVFSAQNSAEEALSDLAAVGVPGAAEALEGMKRTRGRPKKGDGRPWEALGMTKRTY